MNLLVSYNVGSKTAICTGIRFMLALIFVFCVPDSIRGQNTVFSQYYLAPTFTNPAFTGMTSSVRYNLNYRHQFSGFGVPYKTGLIGADTKLNDRHSLGGKLSLDNAGNGILTDIAAGLLYSYELQIRSRIKIKMGIDFSVHQFRLNRAKLLFGDQLDPSEGVISINGVPVQSTDLISSDKIFYPTVGFGLMAYHDRFYAGFSMNNLNTPDATFLENFEDGDVPILTTAQAGMIISLKDLGISRSRASINPMIHYSKQKLAQQITLGAIFHTDFVQLGALFRQAKSNPDAVILSLGLEREALRIGYSYDWTISNLAGASGGTHELGLLINLDKLAGQNNVDLNDCFSIFR